MIRIASNLFVFCLVVCAVSLFSGVCYGGEFSFRGIPLGKTIEESGLKHCNKTAQNPLCYEQDEWEKQNEMYTLRNLPDIGIDGRTQVETKDGIMEKIYFQFPTYETATLVKTIWQKYGTPKASKGKVQNKLGASFDNTEFKWRVKGYEIVVSRYGLDLNNGLLTIDAPASRGKMSKKEKESLAKAKGNL